MKTAKNKQLPLHKMEASKKGIKSFKGAIKGAVVKAKKK